MDLSFYCGKHVLVTGHTGFKGTWLCKMLVNAGAVVTGYSLEPPTTPNLFSISGLGNKMKSIIADIRDFEKLKAAFSEAQPEIVLHLAAQPIVRESYKDPRYTYETNVMGTVNLMECVRLNPCVKSVLNVTTDKVYKNNEWCWGYREDEPLDGFDQQELLRTRYPQLYQQLFRGQGHCGIDRPCRKRHWRRGFRKRPNNSRLRPSDESRGKDRREESLLDPPISARFGALSGIPDDCR